MSIEDRKAKLFIYSIDMIRHVGYDEFDSFVVIAESEGHARALAAGEDLGEDQKSLFLKSQFSTCVCFGEAYQSAWTGEPMVVLGSFNAG